MRFTPIRLAVAAVLVALAAAAALYPGFARTPPPAHSPALMQAVAAQSATYTCPMHASVVQHHPGRCPICGMDLVKAAAPAPGAPLVEVDRATGQRMGVRVAAAEVRALRREVATFATISADDSRTVAVNPKVEGWIRRLYVQGPGQQVRRGQLLYEIYSPELQQRQREYVDLLTRRDGLLEVPMTSSGPNRAMLASLARERFRMRERLLAADMPRALVDRLEQDRRVLEVVPVHAERDGTVQAVTARAGSYVNPMQMVLTYADYRRTWAEITLFPDQLAWIRDGDRVLLSSASDPGATMGARVELANLQVDAASRSARLRVSLDNPHQAFSPGAYADVRVRGEARRALAVPRDALIRTGHGDFVVRADGHGRFRTVPVTVGLQDHELAEIVTGLAAGDQVAVNAQFLLDAAGSMQALAQRQEADQP